MTPELAEESAVFSGYKLETLSESLDLIREIEEAVEDCGLTEHYMAQLQSIIGAVRCELSLYDAVTADPEPRLRALRRTLRGAGEV
jgi:hypothetical protein